MRIVSGSLKGKKIKYLKNKITRPLKDSVKENIFNILRHSNLIKIKIHKSNVLDLYSGVGSFGIECISRGADKVTFIEKDENASKTLKENLISLSIFNKSKIIENKIEIELKKRREEKFNLFFFDPPFADNSFIENLKKIKHSKIFRKNHLIIIHRDKKSNEDFKKIFQIITTKNYGRSKIIFGTFN
tara:strand:+ start:64 stop:624 length:561 start_codon:yes stop_codon:yes gene_type:complete